MFFSIIICCYNSERRIQPTLEYLQRCVVPRGEAELILVDNNCNDHTVELAKSVWCRREISLRVVCEDRAGLSYARQAGMQAAKGDVLLLVDDDNWLCESYLIEVERVFRSNLKVGVVGGCGIAEFGGNEPDWFREHARTYAISADTDESGLVASVFGAGMALRREVYETLTELNFESKLTDRIGMSLASGGDTELCLAARLLGWQVFFTRSASFYHFIPEDRLTLDYLRRLQAGIGQSMPVLALYSFSIKYPSVIAVWLIAILVSIRATLNYWLLRVQRKKGVEMALVRHQSIVATWCRLLPMRMNLIISSCFSLRREHKSNV